MSSRDACVQALDATCLIGCAACKDLFAHAHNDRHDPQRPTRAMLDALTYLLLFLAFSAAVLAQTITTTDA